MANHLLDLVSRRLRYLQASFEEIDAFAVVSINRRGDDTVDIAVVVVIGVALRCPILRCLATWRMS